MKMKKLLLVIPAVALLAACSNGKKDPTPTGSNPTPTQGEPTPTQGEPTPTEGEPSQPANPTEAAQNPTGGQEIDPFPTVNPTATPEVSPLSEALKKGVKALENPTGYRFSASEELSASLEAHAMVVDPASMQGGEDAAPTPSYIPANVAINGGFSGAVELGLAGFAKQNAKVSDLDAYAKAKDVEGKLGLDYSIPEAYLSLLPQQVASLGIKAANQDEFKLEKTNANVYFDNAKVYADVDKATVEGLYNSVLNTKLVDANALFAMAMGSEEAKLPTFDELLAMAGLEGLKVSYALPQEGAETVLPNFDVTSYLPEGYEEMLEAVPQMIAPYQAMLDLANVKFAVYPEGHEYLLSVSASLDKAGLENILKVTGAIDERTTLDRFFGEVGIELHEFEIGLQVGLLRKGGIHFAEAIKAEVKVDVLKLLPLIMGESYATYGQMISMIVNQADAELRLEQSAAATLEVAPQAEIQAQMPKSYEGYQDITDMINSLIGGVAQQGEPIMIPESDKE